MDTRTLTKIPQRMLGLTGLAVGLLGKAIGTAGKMIETGSTAASDRLLKLGADYTVETSDDDGSEASVPGAPADGDGAPQPSKKGRKKKGGVESIDIS